MKLRLLYHLTTLSMVATCAHFVGCRTSDRSASAEASIDAIDRFSSKFSNRDAEPAARAEIDDTRELSLSAAIREELDVVALFGPGHADPECIIEDAGQRGSSRLLLSVRELKPPFCARVALVDLESYGVTLSEPLEDRRGVFSESQVSLFVAKDYDGDGVSDIVCVQSADESRGQSAPFTIWILDGARLRVITSGAVRVPTRPGSCWLAAWHDDGVAVSSAGVIMVGPQYFAPAEQPLEVYFVGVSDLNWHSLGRLGGVRRPCDFVNAISGAAGNREAATLIIGSQLLGSGEIASLDLLGLGVSWTTSLELVGGRGIQGNVQVLEDIDKRGVGELLAWWNTAKAANPIRLLSGESGAELWASESLLFPGGTVCAVTDRTGDGVSEIVVGNRRNDGSEHSNSVIVLDGRNGREIGRLRLPSSFSSSGRVVGVSRHSGPTLKADGVAAVAVLNADSTRILIVELSGVGNSAQR